MKKLAKSLLILALSFANILAFSQNDCKVLKPEIADSYSGKCKKGLAHGDGVAIGTDKYEGHFKKGLPDGKGIYTWATGEVYAGEWRDGLRNGIGVFSFNPEVGQSELDGIWKADEYIGKQVPKPRVLYQENVHRHSITKTGDILERVLVDLYQNGSRNVSVENYLLASSGGYDTNLGHSRGYEGIVFPVILKIRYTTWNELKTYKYNAVFEVEISEPGDWRVTLYN